MGENVPYEREIVRGFMQRLDEGLRSRRVTHVAHPDVVPKYVGTFASPNSDGGRATWNEVIEDIRRSYPKGSIDYFVTLGTFASLAIKQSNLIYELEAQGMIYLGVTDPKKAGLEIQYKIAGVRYGTGGLDYGKKISELFVPDQRLVFIYQRQDGNIQDQAIVGDLEALNEEYARTEPSFRRPRFDIRPIDGLIDVGTLKLADRNNPVESEIYFAWYGLDNILSQENKSSLHNPRLWIVPSTYSEKNLNLAGVIVTVDDAVVGSLGADMILSRIDDPAVPLEVMPVGTLGFRIWIKRDALERKGMKLLEAALHRENIPGYSYR